MKVKEKIKLSDKEEDQIKKKLQQLGYL